MGSEKSPGRGKGSGRKREKVRYPWTDAPLAYYHQHYPGVTRENLKKANVNLYHRLHELDLIDNVPKKAPNPWVEDPLTYYHEHCAGMTRGQLWDKRRAFYNYLLKNGLIDQIPKKS